MLPTKREAHAILRKIGSLPAPVRSRLVDRPLVLYGAGNLGRMAKTYFDALGISVHGVVDINARLLDNDDFWSDVRLLHPADVPENDRKSCLLAVTIANLPYERIAAELERQGWRDIVMFYDIAEAYRDRHPLSNGWFAGKLEEDELRRIEQVLDRWEDDISRAHHLQFIAWRCLRTDWTFADAAVSLDDRFFIPQVRDILTERESFADIGAYHGEVTMHFLRTVSNGFSHVWAVEPDRESLEKMRTALAVLPGRVRTRITVFDTPVRAEPGECLFFQGLGYASQISTLGNVSLKCATIDQLGIEPTLMKLHLEGGELDAMKGAKKTLQACRPIIAVTAYHDRAGLWELPRWIMEKLLEYHFLFRLHSWCGTGAVVYAIPAERVSWHNSYR